MKSDIIYACYTTYIFLKLNFGEGKAFLKKQKNAAFILDNIVKFDHVKSRNVVMTKYKQIWQTGRKVWEKVLATYITNELSLPR